MNTKAKPRVLVVIAHPDDEIFVSGTLCLLQESGFETTVVCVTDGEGGPSCATLPEVDNKRAKKNLRRLELSSSAMVLGVFDVELLGFADIPSEEWEFSEGWDLLRLKQNLERLISDLAPQLILTHGPLGGYGHAAHKQVGLSVLNAAISRDYPDAVYSFCGRVSRRDFLWRYFDEPSDVLIDVRAYNARRIASLNYHQSQWGFFLKPLRPATMRSLMGTLFGIVFSFTWRGRRHLPIVSTASFFNRFPTEGLVLQRAAKGLDFFQRYFAGDSRIRSVARGQIEPVPPVSLWRGKAGEL